MTFPGYRRKPFVLPVRGCERGRSLPLRAPQATKKRSHTIPPSYSGKWPTAPFSSQRASAFTNSSVRASYTASCGLSRTCNLAYQRTPCLRTLQSFSL